MMVADQSPQPVKIVTAAFVVIGDEILSGRTRDANIHHLAGRLTDIGVELREVRLVRDTTSDIVTAVNTLRPRYSHVFTSGGIGPTHDDITADAIARAFAVKLREDPRAVALLRDFYADDALTEARLRMARIPEGAALIRNCISAAPGFRMENVHVMAGIPDIMQAMLEEVIAGLETGTKLLSRTIDAALGESRIAKRLAEVQKAHDGVTIGSYPRVIDGKFATQIVLRAHHAEILDQAAANVRAIVATTLDHKN